MMGGQAAWDSSRLGCAASDRLERAGSLDRVVIPMQRIVRKIPAGRFRDGLHGVWPAVPAASRPGPGAGGRVDVGRPPRRHAGRRTAGPALHRPRAAGRRARRAGGHGGLGGDARAADARGRGARGGELHGDHLVPGFAGRAVAAADRAGSGPRLRRPGRGAPRVACSPRRSPTGRRAARTTPRRCRTWSSPDWHDLLAVDALSAGKPVRVLLGEVPVLAVRDADHIYALADKCAHMSGPLSEGAIADGCVTCPWHGSEFRLGTAPWCTARPPRISRSSGHGSATGSSRSACPGSLLAPGDLYPEGPPDGRNAESGGSWRGVIMTPDEPEPWEETAQA